MTLAIVRSDLAAHLLEEMERSGWITVLDASHEDPEAIALVTRLAAKQRKRWPAPPDSAGDSHAEPAALPGS